MLTEDFVCCRAEEAEDVPEGQSEEEDVIDLEDLLDCGMVNMPHLDDEEMEEEPTLPKVIVRWLALTAGPPLDARGRCCVQERENAAAEASGVVWGGFDRDGVFEELH